MSDVILVVGSPASGKSSKTTEKYPSHVHMNRDKSGGKVIDLMDDFEKNLSKGKQILLDNTFPTIESRKPFLDKAKEMGKTVSCMWIDTKLEDAQVNALRRMWERYGKIFFTTKDCTEVKDPNMFPPAALFSFRKKFEKPTKDEGFEDIDRVKFVREPYGSEYKNKAIILDYDGTLRDTISGDKYPCSPDDVKVLPNREKKLKELGKQGYLLLGVSNQSGIGKGVLTDEDAIACFERTNELLNVDIDYHYCSHRVPPITCYCRKPQSGFGVYLIEKHKLDPTQTIMVGDMTSDKTFATRAGFQYVDAEEFFK